jgi:hypothetical protein
MFLGGYFGGRETRDASSSRGKDEERRCASKRRERGKHDESGREFVRPSPSRTVGIRIEIEGAAAVSILRGSAALVGPLARLSILFFQQSSSIGCSCIWKAITPGLRITTTGRLAQPLSQGLQKKPERYKECENVKASPRIHQECAWH